MKLATYRTQAGEIRFGPVVAGRVAAFTDLQARAGGPASPRLASVEAYLAGLPGSFDDAQVLADRFAADITAGIEDLGEPIGAVRLLPAVPRPAALLDCALTPRHLRNSAATLLRRSLPPGLGALVAVAARPVMGRPPRSVRYYKGNHHSVIGDGDTIGWPGFTAYLDIEPELAFVTGPVPCGASRKEAAGLLAGYLVFNDASARDVQLPEMFFSGPAASKDFDAGNGLGPLLVTPDELGDPLALGVTVEITGRAPWTGTTAEYAMHPLDVLVFLAGRQTLASGTVVGLGTIPDCCGLDRDEWIRPGDDVVITFDGLGTLRQRVGVPERPPVTRWRARTDLGPGTGPSSAGQVD